VTGLELTQGLLGAALARGAPLLFAALGELWAERSGVLNLGLEGVLLASAMTGVAGAQATGSAPLGLALAVLAGALFGLLHAWLTVGLKSDQVVSGLAIVFLGAGLSSVGGASLVGQVAPSFGPAPIPGLAELPLLGPALFSQPWLVYLALLAVPAAHLLLTRTRWGLVVTAAGEHPSAAAAMGVRVQRVRATCVVVGGALAGLGGGTLSLAITPGWVDGLTAGQGWIVLGLVIAGGWRPWSIALGALVFGVLTRLGLDLQGSGLPLFQDPNTGYVLSMLPYLAAILVLVLAGALKRGRGAPSALGRPWWPGQTR
jgi:general nucleoside transport system permease protein